jgi:hypothetical protein
MHTLFALLMLSVTLSAPFGEAEARAIEVGADGMVLEIEVTIDESALVVLARAVGVVDEASFALAELGPGRWGGVVEIPVVEDILMGFEIIRPNGESSVVSDLNRLSDLGVDPAVFGVGSSTTTTAPTSATPETVAPSADSGPSAVPIWMAIVAGAAALALLLVWSLGDRSAPNTDDASPRAEGDATVADGVPPPPEGVDVGP